MSLGALQCHVLDSVQNTREALCNILPPDYVFKLAAEQMLIPYDCMLHTQYIIIIFSLQCRGESVSITWVYVPNDGFKYTSTGSKKVYSKLRICTLNFVYILSITGVQTIGCSYIIILCHCFIGILVRDEVGMTAGNEDNPVVVFFDDETNYTLWRGMCKDKTV